MKKLLVIGVVCAAVALGAYAHQYRTWCGVVVETVEDSYFTDPQELRKFKDELDIAYCGSTNPNPDPNPSPMLPAD